MSIWKEREREKWPIQNYILIANYMSIVAAKGTNTHTHATHRERERKNGLVKQEYRMENGE